MDYFLVKIIWTKCQRMSFFLIPKTYWENVSKMKNGGCYENLPAFYDEGMEAPHYVFEKYNVSIESLKNSGRDPDSPDFTFYYTSSLY
jgi:hypothetical protein